MPKLNLSEYLMCVTNVTTHEEWWNCFSDFLSYPTGTRTYNIPAESHEYQGTVYTLMGNLIFYFNRAMHTHWRSPILSIQKLLEEVRKQHRMTRMLAITTNGVSFHAYIPSFSHQGLLLDIKPEYGLNLASPMMTSDRANEDIQHILYNIM